MAELFEDTDFAYQLQLKEALAASSRETSVHDEVVDEQIARELALQEVKEEAKRTEQTKYVEERDKTLALELALEELSVHAPSTSTAAAYLSDLYRSQQPDEFRITCDICLDAKPASSFLMLEACQHMFCGECTSNYVEAQVKISRVPVVCPQEGCYHFLGDDDFSQLTLPPPILESLTKQEVVASIPETERFYCPFPDCSALMAKPENDASTKSRRLSALRMLGVSWFDEEPRGIGSVECFSCHRLFCAECRVPWHNGYTCKQFQKMTPEDFKMAEDDQAFKDLVKAKKWMRCSKCNSIVERSQGCNHMTCRCRYQFCYRCGRDWQICYYSPCLA